MQYLNAFLCGGILCAIGQIFIDKTQLTPARILTGYVVTGVFLEAIGVYGPIADWGGAGATVPLTGFGSNLAKGVSKAVGESGWLGVLTGGLTATAGGIAAAVLFSFLAALAFRPGEKSPSLTRRETAGLVSGHSSRQPMMEASAFSGRWYSGIENAGLLPILANNKPSALGAPGLWACLLGPLFLPGNQSGPPVLHEG